MSSPPADSTGTPWRARRVSPQGFRLIAAVSVWAIALTIISGAAVRLTGSGLGCPDWPTCTATSIAAPLQVHAWIEFGNRLINAFVTLASIGALAAALLRSPKRRDLTLLSTGLVVGLFGEVALGALVVEFKLAPGLVMAHFLFGVLLLADSVILSYLAGTPDRDHRRGRAAPVALVGRTQIALSRLMLAALAVVVVLGTVVTSTGPHGGSPTAARFGFSLQSVARLHGTAAEIFLGITILALWNLSRTAAPRIVMRRAQVVLVAVVAQAGVGYAQYFNGDPVALVAVHVAGASLLVIAAIRFHLGLWAYPADPAESTVEPTSAGDAALNPARALSATL
jgi:cytochrome c oxidase assembly protein subunit 15